MIPQLMTTNEMFDPAFYFIFGICLAMLVGITAVMLFFVFLYHHRRHPKARSERHTHLGLEIFWTVIPTILVMAMFYYGWAGYLAMRNVPEDALEVDVTGRMWSWSFSYPNGLTSDTLKVPAARPVKVNITSEDVLHSFFIPAFRVKRDAVPGMTTYLWFVAPEPGSYDVFCAEYCGVAHADMITTVEALPEDEFDQWYSITEEEEREEGMAILKRHGCLGCHSLDGSKSVGPTLQGLLGREVVVTTDGEERTLTADADYIRRSILEPQADLVKGYPPVMPSFKERISEHEIEEIIELLGGEQEEEDSDQPSGRKLAQGKGCLGCHSTDGSRKVGPTFKGLFGKQVTVTREGEEVVVTADADYLRRAIREPKSELVKGFPPVMPAFPDLTEEEVTALIDYLKELR